MKTYEGTIIDGEPVVRVDGQPLALEPSLKVHNHSPNGFAWGYGGSGPAQLALAILLDYYEADGRHAADWVDDIHQDFKWLTTARWTHEQPWRLTGEEIEATVKAIEEDRSNRRTP